MRCHTHFARQQRSSVPGHPSEHGRLGQVRVGHENSNNRRTAGAELSERDLRVMKEERYRLVREIQGGLLGSLTEMGLRLDLCRILTQRRETAAVADELAQLRLDLLQIAAGMRELMAELRCPRLRDLSTCGIIERCVRDHEGRANVRVVVDLVGLADESLDIDQKLAVFRIMQEALRNVRQHSGASRVQVCGAQRESLVQLSLEDDGKGFDLLAVSSSYPRRGMGLAGMHERAKAVGGQVEIDSEPGLGTRITLTIPLRHGETLSE
jgi:signal transduction histidine kinase